MRCREYLKHEFCRLVSRLPGVMATIDDVTDSAAEAAYRRTKAAEEAVGMHTQRAADEAKAALDSAGKVIREKTNWDEVKEKAGETSDAVAEGADRVAESIKDKVVDAGEALESGASRVSGALKEKYDEALNYIKNV